MSECSIDLCTKAHATSVPTQHKWIHRSCPLSKSSLTSSCWEPWTMDISHQLPFKSPPVSRGQSKAKSILTGPCRHSRHVPGLSVTSPMCCLHPQPQKALARGTARVAGCCQTEGRRALIHPPSQKAIFALSPRLKAFWVNSSLPPGSFRIFPAKVILGF